MPDKITNKLLSDLDKHNDHIANMSSLEIIEWAFQTFNNRFAFTTSFGIQSTVLLNILGKSTFKNSLYFSL